MFMIEVFIKAEFNIHEDSHIFETHFHVSCISVDDAEVVQGRGQILQFFST